LYLAELLLAFKGWNIQTLVDLITRSASHAFVTYRTRKKEKNLKVKMIDSSVYAQACVLNVFAILSCAAGITDVADELRRIKG
jgi:hypothetical protein